MASVTKIAEAIAEAGNLVGGGGAIRAVARYPEIDAFILKHHGKERPLTPKEMAIITEETNAQMRVIRRNWPVSTGTSRAGWTYYIQPNPGRVAVVFSNPVPYSAYVQKKGQRPTLRNGGKPWYQILLPQVLNANKPRLLRRVKEEILKTEAQFAVTQQVGEQLFRIGSRVAATAATARTARTALDIARRTIL
jgi:hypothetical protein